jgi:leader peptidase (prepilin peptidase)/N-methyltransferase
MSAFEMFMSIALMVALLTASLIDMRSFRLPDWITLPLLLAGTIAVASVRHEELAPAILTAAGTYLAAVALDEIYFHLRGQHGLGRGDAKLMAAGGMWLGFESLLHMLTIACASAFMYVAIARLLRHCISAQTRIPFGPFLSLGFFASWVFLIWGE